MRRGLGFVLGVGGVLLGGVALAQQGLIIDPWGRHAPRPLTPLDITGSAVKAPRSPSDPASALKPGPKSRLIEAEPEPGGAWKPDVPVDLIDPWAPPATPVVTAAASRQNWARPLVDLVDPWAAERVSIARSASPRQSIY